MRLRHLIELFAFSALTALATPIPAFAESADSAASETLFREGKRLLDQKDFARACPKLAESFRLEAATGTLLALAMCHEAEGKIASAWAEYVDAAARARREGRSDREQAAQQWSNALEPKLSTLTILVPDLVARTPGLEVKRDGVVIGQAAWGTAVPIDQGQHAIEVTAASKRPWTKTIVVIAPSSREKLSIPPLDDLPAENGSQNAAERSGLSSWQKFGLVTGGIGVLAIGVGGYFGVQAIRKNNTSNDGCDGDLCTPEASQTRLEARTAGDVSTAAFVGGGAFLIGGAILYLAGGASPSKRGSARVLPSLGTSSLGVAIAGGF